MVFTKHHYVYVTLEWIPSSIKVKPEGTLDLANNRIQELWYTAETDLHTGYDEIHMNVRVPVEHSEIDPEQCTFDSHLYYAFKQNYPLTVTLVDNSYTSFADALLTKYAAFADPDAAFANAYGASGIKYAISANQVLPGGTSELIATASGVSTPIAEIDVKTINNEPGFDSWTPAYNSVVIRYKDNDVAKDVLNYAGHKELAYGKTLTGKIQIKAYNQCGDYLPLNNSTFNVRFLRPLNVEVTDAQLEDALDAGSTIDLQNLLKFTDWRDVNLNEDAHLYRYYDVQAIKVGQYVNGSLKLATGTNINGVATTNLGGGTLGSTTIASVTPQMELVYNAASIVDATNKGTITYYNHTNNIGDFKIQIPLIVVYKWGNLPVILNVNVKHTQGNN
jgi:hypothetical protein